MSNSNSDKKRLHLPPHIPPDDFIPIVRLTSVDAPPTRRPNDEVPRNQAVVFTKSATPLIDQALPDIVSSTMTCTEIVTILTSHGCADLTLSLDESACSRYPIANGGLGDVFSGKLLNGMAVAIKTIRPFYDQGQSARMYHKQASKEIYTWSKCKHPNVVRLIGLAVFRDSLAMISRWEENGNLVQYLTRHPSADRCRLSTSICAGLAYLHGEKIIHGDLKGLNILISKNGTPKLMDFGNAQLEAATLQFTQTKTGPSHSLRWAAPEILGGTNVYSFAGDIYALGMTIMEALTSEIPFEKKVKSDKAIVTHVLVRKKTPERPMNIIPETSICGNILWAILMSCWSYNPKRRPSAEFVWEAMKPLTPENLKEIEDEPEEDED